MKGSGAIWAVTTIVVASIAGIVALAAVGDKDAATLLPLLIGFLAPTIASLVAANKASENSAALTRIDGRLNGELDTRIEQAVGAALTRYHAATREDCVGDNCPA
jgi:hypothetical protein